MRFRVKLIIVALMAALVVGILYIGNLNNKRDEESKTVSDNTETVYLWYSDASFTEFFTYAAVAFHEKYSGIRVIPVLVDEGEYLESINFASVKGEDFPDIILLANDSLEKAYLAGLASEVKDPTGSLADGHFPKAAIDAVSYKNKLIGYPLSYETSVLLYNKTYLKNWAEKVNAGWKSEAGESLDESEVGEYFSDSGEIAGGTNGAAEEQKTVTYEDYIPKTVDDLLSFADGYQPEEGVTGILKWDVSDIFYNYFFVGNSMIVGGNAGDDRNNINIYNEDTIKCLQIYQGLNQFFSISVEDSKAEDVLRDFINGKYVYTIATSNAIEEINKANRTAKEKYESDVRAAKDANEEAKISAEEGTTPTLIDIDAIPKPLEYGYALVPDISGSLCTKSLSVTDVLALNGYSEHKTAAEKFAAFVTTTYANQLYSRTGRLAAYLDSGYTTEDFLTFQKEYARSIPLPKIVEASNLWVQLEITFTKIWQGESVEEHLKDLNSQIQSQLGGG
ncbi:MAG: extracellular solute-binding protein [Lachnospiraceae bacterium]|nr:extracellular solute-binding protein [Lachnospiraceae bacterium]